LGKQKTFYKLQKNAAIFVVANFRTRERGKRRKGRGERKKRERESKRGDWENIETVCL
jgi:hypothetical protein